MNGESNGNRSGTMSFRTALSRLELGRLLWRERRVVIMALAAATVAPLAAMALPLATRVVVDEVIGKGRRELLVPLGLLAAFGLLVQAAATYGAAQFGALAGLRIATSLRRRIHQHTLQLPARYFDSQQSGALVSRIITDTDQLRTLVGSGVLHLVSGVLSGVIAFAVLWSINWRLTAVLCGLLVVVTVGLTRGFRGLGSSFREAAELQARLAGRLTQVLGGIMMVKTCAAERREGHRFARDSHRILRASLAASRSVSGLIAAIALAIGGVSLVLLVLGGQAVAAGGMTLGDLALFIVLVGMLGTPVVQTAAISAELGRAVAALTRMAEILELEPEPIRPAGRRLSPTRPAGIVFDRVSYAYEPGRPVLRDVSFTAAPGTVTALSGPNGAGKSTLLGLLMGLDAPSSGRILVDERPLSELNVGEYRRSLGVVLQQQLLFDGSVEENIRYGRPGASVAEFHRAARLAHCDEFVELLPQGYATLVGERGVRLSGGQRQRVAIARAILADPRILLLDEATNQLDPASELFIQEALVALCCGRTTFVIAHRHSTIRQADQILVLQSGAVVERGTHEELLLREGPYAWLHGMKHKVPLDLSARWAGLDGTQSRATSPHANEGTPSVA
jgi:ABC-type multidrug transport system fused ATPase/permease subunit